MNGFEGMKVQLRYDIIREDDCTIGCILGKSICIRIICSYYTEIVATRSCLQIHCTTHTPKPTSIENIIHSFVNYLTHETSFVHLLMIRIARSSISFLPPLDTLSMGPTHFPRTIQMQNFLKTSLHLPPIIALNHVLPNHRH